MSGSKIEWTEQVWEVTAGCSRVSEGCRNCYAEKLVGTRFYGMAERRARDGVADGSVIDVSLKVINPSTKKWNGRIELLESNLDQPLKRKMPTVYFVNSRSDLFHPDVPFGYIDRVFAVMALCPQHRFQVLTKRPERMAKYLQRRVPISGTFTRKHGCKWHTKTPCDNVYRECNRMEPVGFGERPLLWPLPNVWLGTSVEDQATADERVPHLLACPVGIGAGRFLSVEPMLGEVDLTDIGTICMNTDEPFVFNALSSDLGEGLWFSDLKTDAVRQVDWVIVGGESGAEAEIRGCGIDWIRSIVRQCKDAGVPVFVKQLGGRPMLKSVWANQTAKLRGCGHKGELVEMWPEDLRVRQVPEGLRVGEEKREKTPSVGCADTSPGGPGEARRGGA